MTLKYESEILFDLMKRDGDDTPSDVLPYESELKEKYLEQVEGGYPKLQDYLSEWLYYNLIAHIPADFPIETLSNVTEAIVYNVVPYSYTSAILKGNTGYRDIDTGEILETFEEGRNLELVSVKMPVLTTANTDQLSTIPFSFFERPAQNKFGWCSFVFDEGFSGKIRLKLMSEVARGIRFVCFASEEMVYSTEDVKNGIDIEVENASYIGFYDVESGISVTSKGNLLQFIKDGDIKITLQEKGKPSVYTYKDIDKTNILTVNEEVELRGIGDVKDELDLMTGEYVQRIGEVKITDEMIDKFALYKNFIYNFSIVFDGLPERKIVRFDHGKPIPMVSDKMAVKLWSNETMVENTVYFTQDKDGEMRAYHSPDWTLDEFKEWFRENKPTIQYELATPIVKTVDLTVTDQDGNTKSIIRPIEGTMYLSTSGETIKPTFSGEIPVESITQNLASFIEE